jgi:CRP/FNR family transcriptional regulator, dissimilatory nitrate respiration regulator
MMKTDAAAAGALPATFEAGALVHTLAAGDKLFQTGDRAVAIYQVERGRLRLIRRTVDDHLVVLHTACAGEFLAEASLFSETYHCDGVAVVPSRVRAYPKAALLAAFCKDRGLAEAFMARLAHQVQDLRARLELRNIHSARERVQQYLRLRAEADRRSVAIEGPYQDIAAEIGLTREALYRTLARLEAEGVIERDRSGITLKKSQIA